MQITITEIEKVDTKLVLFKFRTDIRVSVTVIEWHGIIDGKITFKTPLETYSFDVYSIVSILDGPAPQVYTALDRFVEHEVYDARLQEIYNYLVRNIIQGCCCDTPSPSAGSFDEVATYGDLPITGITDVLYYVADEGNFYVWDGAAYFSPDKVITSTASGTDTYTGTGSPTILGWEENVIYKFRFTNANTGASTYNLDAVGAVDIVTATGAALIGGEIPADSIQFLVYDGTDLRLMGGGGSSAATWGSITGTITAQTDLVDTVQNSEWIYGSTTGTNTYLVNLSPALTAYQTGQVFWILFGNANTGAATLNVNSLGAIALRKNVSTALVSGDIPAGAILPVMYDGTNFQVDLRFAGNPTWQQVLIAGSTLTQNNTIDGGGFQFTWDNFLRFIVYTTQRIALVCDNGLGDTSNFQVAPASVGTTVGDGVNNSTVSQNSTQFLIELAALNEHQAADLPSAATTDLAQLIGNSVTITGTTTITSFGSVDSGARRMVTFAGILTLTHNATSLILPTGANIVTAAGDTCIAISLGSGNWKVFDYTRASGEALSAPINVHSIVKENTTISHTGTTTETLKWSQLVAGGTFAEEDVFEFSMFMGGNGSGNKTYRLYANTASTLAGATLIGTYAYTAANLWGVFTRNLIFNDSITSQKVNNVTTRVQTSGANNTAAVATLSIDFTVDQYFIISIELATSANTCNIWGIYSQLNR